MPVEIHTVEVGLVWIGLNNKILVKNNTDTKLSDFTKGDVRQEHRVFPNLTGAGSTANSDGYPTIAEYLEAEAGDDFAFAYMDQNTIITQRIT